MGEIKQYLISMGVPSIKKYVFGTDRLIEIRGASALLDNLNRKETALYLQNQLPGSQVDCVFANGGSAQFIVTAKEGDVDRCLRNLEAFFLAETRGEVRLIFGKAELSEANYTSARSKAYLDSEKKAHGAPFISNSTIHTGFLRECDSCSGIASQIQNYDDEQRVLCDSCYRKANYGKEAKSALWQEFSDKLSKKGVQTTRPASFEEIGQYGSANKGYTALVYADGNGMGKLIKGIQSWQEYRFFSETVDTALREACHESLFEVFWSSPNQVWRTLPAEIMLAGGDDLLVYITADKAIPFAIKTADKFRANTQKAFASSQYPFFRNSLNGEGVTISLGIAIGKIHTPFSILLMQAEELLNSAKRAGSSHKRSNPFIFPTYIDYHLTSYYNQINVEDCRSDHLKIETSKAIRLYHKPYSVEEARTLLTYAEKLAMSKIPRTRLKRFGYAPALGKMNGTLECLKLYTRTSDEIQQTLIREALSHFGCFFNMPWNEKNPEYDWTMLVDLMELVDLFSADSSD